MELPNLMLNCVSLERDRFCQGCLKKGVEVQYAKDNRIAANSGINRAR